VEFFLVSTLNALAYGLLLFMLSSGLTLIFSMMGVLNFAHASFYMLGAYCGYTVSRTIGFWPALFIAPLLVGLLGALFERLCLRRVHAYGHVPELLMTFGLSYVVLEAVQLLWGRLALEFTPPAVLQGPAFTLLRHPEQGLSLLWGSAPASLCQAIDVVCTPFPATRALLMLTALAMLAALWLLLARTRLGWVIRAALTHPDMVQALGHDVPAVFMGVFGVGTALAGLAGVIGGSTFVTEPAMAATLGPIVFVVVMVGGIGSLAGAFAASLLIGVIQTFAVALDGSLGAAAARLGIALGAQAQRHPLLTLTTTQLAPMLPYLLLVLLLIWRPRGLLGTRDE
jgi:branched-chain amino acid transport system permease protein